jgi:hypothetical protein
MSCLRTTVAITGSLPAPDSVARQAALPTVQRSGDRARSLGGRRFVLQRGRNLLMCNGLMCNGSGSERLPKNTNDFKAMQPILIPPFPGSNPGAPANQSTEI